MGLFNTKNKISSYAMQKLLIETCKTRSTDIYDLFDKVGIVYDEVEVQLTVLTINLELCRYSLYTSNKKELIDEILKNAYNEFFKNLLVSAEVKREYSDIMTNVSNKLRTIFSVQKLLAPKEEFVYRLLLEQLEINEKIIDRMYIPEFMLYCKQCVFYADNINKTYMISDSLDDKKRNEALDFRF